jgi:hypothetical protein
VSDLLEGRSGSVAARATPTGTGKRVPVTLVQLEDAGEQVLDADAIDPSSKAAREKLAGAIAEPLQADARTALLELGLKLITWRSAHGTNGAMSPGAASDEPWPDPVDGAELLADIDTFIARYIALKEEARAALALWVVHTHCMEVADHTPYIRISSATRECGKTALLEVLHEIVARPWSTSGVTGAALFRKIHQSQPTLLLDEIDTQMANEETAEVVRGVLNAGFKRGGTIDRCVGEGTKIQVEAFNVFCAKALAGIRQPADTILSRSIPVRLEHEPRVITDRLAKVRARPLKAAATPLRRRVVRFAQDSLEELRDADPSAPASLGARQADVWSPLFAIADLVGGVWKGNARLAAEILHGVEHEEGDRGLLLLEDLRDIFGDASGPEHLATAKIIEELIRREDRPWAESSRGAKPITPVGLARVLARFKVRPENVRIGNGVAKGYKRERLDPLWEQYRIGASSRYAPPSPLHVEDVGTPTLELGFGGDVAAQRGKGGQGESKGGAAA